MVYLVPPVLLATQVNEVLLDKKDPLDILVLLVQLGPQAPEVLQDQLEDVETLASWVQPVQLVPLEGISDKAEIKTINKRF